MAHFAMKSFKCLLHFSGFFSVGGGDRGIDNIAFIGCCPYKGGVPSATSMVVIPRDHTSALMSYSYTWFSQAITCTAIPLDH